MNAKINEIAYLRNRLSSGQFNSSDQEILTKIEKMIKEADTAFQELMIQAINNLKSDLKEGRFKSAAYELNLIHNFPFENTQAWDSEYFYNFELVTYLSQNENAERIKKLIILLANLQNDF